DLQNANRMLADVFRDVGAARRPPADVAAVEFDLARLPAFLPRHHAVVEIDQHPIRCVAVLRDGGRPRLERCDDDARLRRLEARRDRRGRLSLQDGCAEERDWPDEACASNQTVHSSPPIFKAANAWRQAARLLESGAPWPGCRAARDAATGRPTIDADANVSR